MKQLKLAIILISIALVVACSSENSVSSSGIEANKSWPYKIEGDLDIIDAAASGNDPEIPGWIIGTITPANGGEDILVEFKEMAAESSGFTMDFEYTNPISVWVNQAKNEYYQVESVE